MNKNIVIVIAVLVVAFFVWKYIPMGSKPITLPIETSNTETDATTVSVTTNIVSYDGTSFTPATISIKQGDSVTFINNTEGKMSVASNPHPAHTDYPEFDQYKTSSRGQKTFTFTFEKIGTWGYHNHLNATAGGTVVVTAK
ncbi:MAG: hypothetical protein WAV25_03245 [Minisyncoccia bacterium]